MKVVGFYTRDTAYENLASRLEGSLVKYGIDYILEGITDRGSWLKNTGYKPTFLRDIIEETDDDIFYVDVDAKFKRFPTLFKYLNYFDLGVCYLNNELLSGSIFIKNTSANRVFLTMWKDLQEDDDFDQRTLQKLVKENILDLNIIQLPSEYCCIFDTMSYIENPVIVHYQASRNFRKDYGEEKPISAYE